MGVVAGFVLVRTVYFSFCGGAGCCRVCVRTVSFSLCGGRGGGCRVCEWPVTNQSVTML